MEGEDGKKLRAARAQCKRTITLVEKYLQTGTDLDVHELKVHKQSLIKTQEKYEHILEQMEYMNIDKDEDLTERIWSAMSSIETHMTEDAAISTRSCPQNLQPAYDIKLPAIEIPTFDGKDLNAFKPFMDLFLSVIHKDNRLQNVQKLYYLKRYLKNEPLKIIDNLPLTDESYINSLDLLNKRYNNLFLLVNNHICTLFDLPSISKGTAQQLRDFTSSFRQQLSALKNLNQKVEYWDSMLISLITRKLDSLTVRLFHTNRDITILPSVDNILDFLDNRALALESSPTSTSSRNYYVNLAGAQESNKSRSTNNNCKLCSQNHFLFKCPTFLLMPVEERHKYIDEKSLCKICLRLHTNKVCRYNFNCAKCKSKDHNTLIHLDSFTDAESQNQINLIACKDQHSNCGMRPVLTHWPQL
ncbi:hypothetical protein K1T71_002856 [Dendrolimus kikuchii]|uniref:Uncharacterized protein n=1 Tax=Dendrolimus kikuchii TaxID=765133 RepID=A0ACC1DDU6_9NEOP|nr:hypothetical protein K1T71_002856 [Dendrolimus kikuchii]